ncbi:hypothetical protein [Mycolicibacterium parafortuitum]|uniref:hypothetical protein n=1 Tax=Mycolicibacterium parafortuitum TaxID=39692 RepID=UPI0013D1C5C7|nr:hypothetical protein [Mycolicibacterium parafortuitum]
MTDLLDAYTEAKRRFHLDDLRPSAVEGGRFSEAAFRILQWQTTGAFTPLGATLTKVPTLVNQLENQTHAPDSVRFHIPRTLRAIYDIRNKRNIAHLADGIDPNRQDATFIIHSMDWVLAELVRLYHSVTADVAQTLIEDLVAKEIPAMQMFDGFPVFLKDMSQPDQVMTLLYWRGATGASRPELLDWMSAKSAKSNMSSTLTRLKQKHYLHDDGSLIRITIAGEQYVETKKLIEPT